MSKITDDMIFGALRFNMHPARLTQEVVDITNLALLNKRREVIKVLDVREPNDRPYNLNKQTLAKVYPKANMDAIEFILKHAPQYGIKTKKQMCAFLATCLLESNGFNAKRESMAYRPSTLVKVFSRKLIPSNNFATNLVSKGQVAIANHLYNGRMGNRVNTNDGWNYRGGGWIQLTGRANYYEIQNLTGIPFGNNPLLIEKMEESCIAAMKYWEINGLNEKAETINVYSNGWQLNTLNSKGRETNDYNMNTGIRLVRRTVNGGYNGLNEVAEYFEACMKYM